MAPRFEPLSAPPDRPHVKVCGLTRPGDARVALECGASYLGLIFAESSPRRVTLGQARSLVAEVPGARWVGVFVHEPIELITEVAVELGLHAVQLHRTATEGDSDRLPVPLWRAIQVRGPETAPEIAAAVRLGPVLLDAFVAGREGGTGKTFDHSLARPHFGAGTVMIAGGLNPGNIAGIAARLAATPPWPYAFDVSSGLESEPGVKDHARVRAFFAELSSGWASGRRE